MSLGVLTILKLMDISILFKVTKSNCMLGPQPAHPNAVQCEKGTFVLERKSMA